MECKYKYDSLCEDESYLIKHSELSAAKKKADKVCLWCGTALKNKEESFCSIYCATMWGGEGD